MFALGLPPVVTHAEMCPHLPIGGIGRLVLAAALAAVVAAACGSSTTESGGDVPIVQIRSLAIAGDVATVTFDASAGGNPVDIVIDWGDGSTTTDMRATGSLQAQHVYDLEALTVTEVTVTVKITDDDGNGGRSAAQLQLVGPITTTPGDATTVPEPNATVEATTTAPPPPTPAPTAAPTPTPPPPPPAPATTTTAPPLEPLVIQLDLADARILGNRSSNDGDRGQLGPDRIGTKTSTIGINETDDARVTAVWDIGPETFAGYGPDPQVSVFFRTQVTATLDTGNWAGMGASLQVRASAQDDDGVIGRAEALPWQIGRDTTLRLNFESLDPLGFGSSHDASQTLQIFLTAECRVAGSTNPFGALSRATCDAFDGNGGLYLREARLTIRPSDG
jgi:hypothetical protein